MLWTAALLFPALCSCSALGCRRSNPPDCVPLKDCDKNDDAFKCDTDSSQVTCRLVNGTHRPLCDRCAPFRDWVNAKDLTKLSEAIRNSSHLLKCTPPDGPAYCLGGTREVQAQYRPLLEAQYLSWKNITKPRDARIQLSNLIDIPPPSVAVMLLVRIARASGVLYY